MVVRREAACQAGEGTVAYQRVASDILVEGTRQVAAWKDSECHAKAGGEGRLTEASCLAWGTAGLQTAEQKEAHLDERRVACPAGTSRMGA